MYIKSRINRVRTPIKRGITQSALSSVSLSLSVCVNKDVKTSSFLDDRLLRAVNAFYEWRGFRVKALSCWQIFLSPIKFFKP